MLKPVRAEFFTNPMSEKYRSMNTISFLSSPFDTPGSAKAMPGTQGERVFMFKQALIGKDQIMSTSVATLEKIVALCKRRGFVYQSAEIYGGLNGVYDFGPLGTTLKNTIKQTWLKYMTSFAEEILLLDGSILGSPDIWKASGHLDNFSDPMVDCLSCKKRYRADELDLSKSCPSCGNKQ
jgi:hypothetical protein